MCMEYTIAAHIFDARIVFLGPISHQPPPARPLSKIVCGSNKLKGAYIYLLIIQNSVSTNYKEYRQEQSLLQRYCKVGLCGTD